MDTDKIYTKALRVLDIPDLSLEDVSNDDTFLLVNSNRDNVHHIYKVQIQDGENWVDITPVQDRVTSCNLAKDDLDILFPKEDGGNEQYNIYLTDFSTNKPELYLELKDARVSTIKRTKDKKVQATKRNSSAKKNHVLHRNSRKTFQRKDRRPQTKRHQ